MLGLFGSTLWILIHFWGYTWFIGVEGRWSPCWGDGGPVNNLGLLLGGGIVTNKKGQFPLSQSHWFLQNYLAPPIYGLIQWVKKSCKEQLSPVVSFYLGMIYPCSAGILWGRNSSEDFFLRPVFHICLQTAPLLQQGDWCALDHVPGTWSVHLGRPPP